MEIERAGGETCSRLQPQSIYFGGRDPPASECDAGADGAGADCAGGLEFCPDDELLLEFDEEFELEEEELEDEEEPDEPDPEDELEPDEESEWEDDPEPPALRVGPASGSPRCPFPPLSCFGGGF